MKFPHTPAPWTLGSNGASTKVVDADGKAVCMVTYRKDHWNGDLLAAAPELLAALEGLLQYTGGWDETDPTHPVVIARAAIAKAKGENA